MRYIVLLLLCSFYIGNSQETIEVSKNYKTVLIFDSPILESINGNPVSYIQEISKGSSAYSQKLLKLHFNRASKEQETRTNLTVITEDGNTYNFFLKYVKTPKKLTWSIKPDDADLNFNGDVVSNIADKGINEDDINLSDTTFIDKSELRVITAKNHKYSSDVSYTIESNKDLDGQLKRRDSLYEYDRSEYYRLKCYYSNYNASKVKRYFVRNGDVFLWFKGIYYNNGDLYVQLKLDNKQTVDMEIDFINFFLATDYNKKSSNQETQIKPIYEFNIPDVVLGKEEEHFTLVFKKFVLEKNTVFRINLKEDNGARILEMDIDRSLINNPVRF